MSDYAAIARNLFSISAVEAEQFGERPEDQASYVAAKAIETLVAEVERLKGALEMTESKLQRLEATMVGYYNEG